MKKIFAIIFYSLLITIFIPFLITFAYFGIIENKPFIQKVNKYEKKISVFNKSTNTESSIPLKYYLKGIIAANIPSEDITRENIEAVKAFAVIARVNTQARLLNIDIPEMKYFDDDMQMQIFSEDYDQKSAIIDEAIDYTQEYIFSNSYIYYVDDYSESEEIHTYGTFESSVSVLKKDFLGKLKSEFKTIVLVDHSIAQQIQIIEKKNNSEVKLLQVGNKVISGLEFKNLFGLNSCSFAIEESENEILINTIGYDKSLQFSIMGAIRQARDGYLYEDILNFYLY